MEQLAVVFSVLYNVLYEKEITPSIDASELVELVEYSSKLIQEEFAIDLVSQDQAFEGISTDITATDRSYSIIDEIIETFNLRYANAEAEIKSIIDDLSNDKDLQSNVQNSTENAYETAVSERVSSKILDGVFDGTINGNTEKAEFFTGISSNESIVRQISRAIIRKIKDLLLAG